MEPDKIYAKIIAGSLHVSRKPNVIFGVPYPEYIRKDALLEWAKEQLNKYKQMDEDFQGDVFIGNRHAFAEVIAKIESL